jgi:hypothetical protein
VVFQASQFSIVSFVPMRDRELGPVMPRQSAKVARILRSWGFPAFSTGPNEKGSYHSAAANSARATGIGAADFLQIPHFSRNFINQP